MKRYAIKKVSDHLGVYWKITLYGSCVSIHVTRKEAYAQLKRLEGCGL